MGYKYREYECDSCKAIWEELLEDPQPNQLKCPKCEAGVGEKVLSAVSGKVIWGYVDSN